MNLNRDPAQLSKEQLLELVRQLVAEMPGCGRRLKNSSGRTLVPPRPSQRTSPRKIPRVRDANPVQALFVIVPRLQ